MKHSEYYIFGLQRSGTNFLEQIISQNIEARKLNQIHTVWKHSLSVPGKYDRSKSTIIMHKNPYSWVESLCDRNSVDWVLKQTRYPVKETRDTRYLAGKNQFDVTQLAKAYRDFMNSWLNLEATRVAVIRYEDLLNDEQRHIILNEMTDKLNLHRKTNKWLIPHKGKVSQSKDYNQDRENYYLEMKPKILTGYQITGINQILGSDLFTKLRYTLIE